MAIPELPEISPPEWLSDLTQADIESGPFPLTDVLRDSFFYPAAGFDWDPVKYLAGNILSFVYTAHGEFLEDFQYRENFDDALNGPGFQGYDIVAKRLVMEAELVPNGWQPIPPPEPQGDPLQLQIDDGLWQEDEMDLDPLQYSDWQQQPFFCQWIVLQRQQSEPATRGPSRFSLLYLRVDGVVAFRDLYPANAAVPKAVAIIQPGNNWTDFANPNGIFATSVLGNPAGQPENLLFGGNGSPDFYEQPCWPIYQQHIRFLDRTGGGSIGVWAMGD